MKQMRQMLISLSVTRSYQQAAEILVSRPKIDESEGAQPLAYLEKIACSSFYAVEGFPLPGAARYFSSLLTQLGRPTNVPVAPMA